MWLMIFSGNSMVVTLTPLAEGSSSALACRFIFCCISDSPQVLSPCCAVIVMNDVFHLWNFCNTEAVLVVNDV